MLYKFSYDTSTQAIFMEFFVPTSGCVPCMIDVQTDISAAVVAACEDLGSPIPRILPAISDDPETDINAGTLDLRWDYFDGPMTALVFETLVSRTRRAIRKALANDAGTAKETLVQAAIDA